MTTEYLSIISYLFTYLLTHFWYCHLTIKITAPTVLKSCFRKNVLMWNNNWRELVWHVRGGSTHTEKQTHVAVELFATMSKSWTVTSSLTRSLIGRRLLAKNDVSQSSSTDGTRTTFGVFEESFSDLWLNFVLPNVSTSMSSIAGLDRFGVERAVHDWQQQYTHFYNFIGKSQRYFLSKKNLGKKTYAENILERSVKW